MTFYSARILGPDTHANRPTASTVPDKSQYVCSTHGIIYVNNAGTWGNWATLGSGDKIEVLMIAVSDETTAITTGTAKVTFRMPWAMTVTAVRASLTTASSSGNPAFDINENGVSILSTTLTIDATEKTSTTAATPAVISDSSLADDAEITIDIDTAGTGAKGLKVYIIGTR
jgi:hypothetical protein